MKEYTSVLAKQRAFFASGRPKCLTFRINSLKRLEAWIKEHDAEVMKALKQDLNKAPFEAYATEIGVVLDELRYAIKHVGQWSRDRHVGSSIKNFPAACYIKPEPYGVVLIMSPWNYPFMLSVAPLIGALAAGNCAVVKPSAYSPYTSALIDRMLRDVFDESHVAVVLGGRRENEHLLAEKFDYICFTGSGTVGKTVMEAAAKHLTPITLELGGKSPCIVDETANLKLAARRIVWGKFINAGQTCVAPDYVMVHNSVKDALLREMIRYIKKFFGERPCENEDYAKIINEKHFNRLLGLLDREHIVLGGESNAKTLQIAPTLLDGVTWDSPVMQEEIFGPLLPVLTFDSLALAAERIQARPKPLALYLFTTDSRHEKNILRNLSFGGGCVNDTVVHLSIPRMPFGGVGESGMGGYHGKFGFETFSHHKSILKKSLLLDIPLRYPPYKQLYLNLLKRL